MVTVSIGSSVRPEVQRTSGSNPFIGNLPNIADEDTTLQIKRRCAATTQQCDQIGQFIGLWATFQSLCQQLFCSHLLHS